jgi:hypothetical protein
LIERIGWLGIGMGFLCAADVIARYFAAAQVTTEIDLRLSLLALCDGREAELNPSMIMSSGRRIVINPRNFAAWCFYDPTYYTEKDINASVKLDLNAPTPVEDLRPDMLGRFFQRRALKLAGRHLIPLVIFDRSDSILEKLSGLLGTDMSEWLVRGLGHLRGEREAILSDRLEAMIDVIETPPSCVELAHRIEHLMLRQYRGDLSSNQ